VTEQRSRETERIWSDFHDRLLAFLRSRVGDRHAAEDILQDVFLKVHLSVGMLRDESKLAPWLYQIARNAIVDHYRTRKTEPLDERSLAAEGENETDKASRSLAESLLAMIDELPPRYRDPLMLSEIEGLTQAQVADRLGLSLSGAKSRVQRGRHRLRERILDCCHVELDRFGGVLDYYELPVCCAERKRGRSHGQSGPSVPGDGRA